jgi:molybdopterin-guanine dinucleotide biosynthesis protein A
MNGSPRGEKLPDAENQETSEAAPKMRHGAVILCGGKSSRMGRDKATVPFGPEAMLQRVVRLVSEVVEPVSIVVVAAPNQLVPNLPEGVQIARDEMAFRGPLQGLVTGLRAIGDRVDAVYSTGCDAPLLVPAFVRRMFELLGEFDMVVPFDGDRHHPLAAVYRPAVLPRAEELLKSGQFSPQALFDAAHTRKVPLDELRDVDSELHTLKNLNREEAYREALEIAGLDRGLKATDTELRGRAK